jgi:hypothetical protein
MIELSRLLGWELSHPFKTVTDCTFSWKPLRIPWDALLHLNGLIVRFELIAWRSGSWCVQSIPCSSFLSSVRTQRFRSLPTSYIWAILLYAEHKRRTTPSLHLSTRCQLAAPWSILNIKYGKNNQSDVIGMQCFASENT